ncbi:MAG: hypothetical protein RQ801_06815, partial [Spirochaetaceae bacterium]|nr:hypothetical protein [Spirochaetaceae bacterium]
MQVFQKSRAVLCGIDEALAVLKVASGRYRDYLRAAKLFDAYLAAKQEARQSYGKNRRFWLETQRQRTEIAEELDSLWDSGYGALDIRALHDGDEIDPWETVLTIEDDMTYYAHLETIYLGILARRTRIATNVRHVVEAADDVPVLFFPARFDHWGIQGGDTVEAVRLFGESYPDTNLVALVDFDNDSVGTALAC